MDELRIGSPVDDFDLESMRDVIEWLEAAEADCSLLAANLKSGCDQAYIQGRAHAFGMAAALVRDLEFRGKLLGAE